MGKGEGRDVIAQRGQRALELLALGRRDRREVDGREDLADLHRGAAHVPELIDELAGQPGGALAGGGLGALGRAHAIGGLRGGPAQALAGHQAAEAARAGEAGSGGSTGHDTTVRPGLHGNHTGNPRRPPA